MSEVDFSVVIATYNRSESLRDCLYSLATQSFSPKRFEIIVVNDGSTDSTSSVLNEFARYYKASFVRIEQANQGVSAARNEGIAVARRRIIVFTDDDCILPPDWLDRLASLWEKAGEGIVGIGGPLNTVTSGTPTFTSRFINYLDEFNYIPVLTDWYIKPVHVSCLTGVKIIPYLRTANASFRKKCLEEIGGFDASFKQPGGEDPDLCYRLMKCEYSFCFDKYLVANHHSRTSLKAYFKSIHNYAIGDMRKSIKRNRYPAAIARCYRFILLQKFVSFVVNLLMLPCNCVRFVLSAKMEYISFQFLICVAKLYALGVSLGCKFRATLGQDNNPSSLRW